MNALIGNWTPEYGHTWLCRGFGKVYSLRSLAGGSFLCVDGKQYPTPGEHSCHITLLNRQAVVADYTSGSLSIYTLSPDGIPESAPTVLNFEGHGPHPTRQTSPHIHSSWISPDGESLVVADLGSDKIYRFPILDGKVGMDGIEAFDMPEGCGPRHCAFGDGVLYVATELSDEVLVLDWPSMDLRQRIVVNDALPEGGGHILLSPDGRFVYVSSRLQNDGIGIFRVLPGGLLEKTGYCMTGAHPRHFCLSPDGKTLAVACRDDNCVQCYSRDSVTGGLTATDETLMVSKPVYVELV